MRTESMHTAGGTAVTIGEPLQFRAALGTFDVEGAAQQTQGEPIKCDYGDACPGHTSPDERPCGWDDKPEQASADGGKAESDALWLHSRIDELRAENEKLRAALADAEKKISQLVEDWTAMRAERDELRAALALAEENLSGARAGRIEERDRRLVAEAERDAARAESAEAIRILRDGGAGDPHKLGKSDTSVLIWLVSNVLERWQGASDDCEKAEAERDAARANYDGAIYSLSQELQKRVELERAQREDWAQIKTLEAERASANDGGASALAIVQQDRDEWKRRAAEAEARTEKLREALRSCASALHNGSDIAPTASDDFHLGVPTEIAAYRRRMDERLKWYEGIAADRDDWREKALRAAADAVVEAARDWYDDYARDELSHPAELRLWDVIDAARAGKGT